MAGELEKKKLAEPATYKANGLSGAAKKPAKKPSELMDRIIKCMNSLKRKCIVGVMGWKKRFWHCCATDTARTLTTASSVKASWQQVANAPAQDTLQQRSCIVWVTC